MAQSAFCATPTTHAAALPPRAEGIAPFHFFVFFIFPAVRPIILASKSPRRSQLLTEAGFAFTVRTKDTDESFDATTPAEDVPVQLAERKAEACRDYLTNDNELILAADTVVILDGVIFNKPADRAEAFEMLSALSGRQHRVVTGVCLLDRAHRVAFSETADVYFRTMTEAEIYHYIDTHKPYDKAGAYGVQDWIGHTQIVRIDGTYTNVMGLPIAKVYEMLQTF